MPAGSRPPEDCARLTAWTDFPIQPGSLTTDGKRLVFVRSFAQRDVYVAGHRCRPIPPGAAAPADAGTRRRLPDGLDPRQQVRHSHLRPLRPDEDLPAGPGQTDAPTRWWSWPGSQILPRMAPDGNSVLFCSMVPDRPDVPLDACALGRGNAGAGGPRSRTSGTSAVPPPARVPSRRRRDRTPGTSFSSWIW